MLVFLWVHFKFLEPYCLLCALIERENEYFVFYNTAPIKTSVYKNCFPLARQSSFNKLVTATYVISFFFKTQYFCSNLCRIADRLLVRGAVRPVPAVSTYLTIPERHDLMPAPSGHTLALRLVSKPPFLPRRPPRTRELTIKCLGAGVFAFTSREVRTSCSRAARTPRNAGVAYTS